MILLTAHIRQQAATKDIPVSVVHAVLNHPSITYKSFRRTPEGNRVPCLCKRHGEQQVKYTGEAEGKAICVAVYLCCNEAVTVWLDQVETELRPDQRAKGYKGYIGRDGKERA